MLQMGKKDGEQKDSAALDKEDPAQIIHQVIPQKIRGNEKDADPDGENSGSEDSGNAADDGKDSGNEAGENTGNEEDNTGESGGENIGDEDPAAEDTDKKTRISPKTIPRIIFPNVRKTSRKVKLTKPKVTGTYLSVRSFRIRTEMI